MRHGRLVLCPEAEGEAGGEVVEPREGGPLPRASSACCAMRTQRQEIILIARKTRMSTKVSRRMLSGKAKLEPLKNSERHGAPQEATSTPNVAGGVGS